MSNATERIIEEAAPKPLIFGFSRNVFVLSFVSLLTDVSSEMVYPIPEETNRSLDYVRSYLWHEFRDSIWFPPNKAGVTAFTKPELSVTEVYKKARAFVIEHRLNNLYVLPHWDAVDVMPKGLDKSVFIRYLNDLGYTSESIVAVGDALNDIPMLKNAGYSITFKKSLHQVKESAGIVVDSIYQAFDVIEDIIKSDRRRAAGS